MIIGNEEVLSRIIKVAVDEAKHLSIEEIRRLIEGVHIGNRIVNPHFHLVDKEGFIKDEGMVYYDILCYIDVPQEDGKNIRVYLNVEIQNNPYPGYSIITRGYAYVSRIVSGQWGSEYDYQHYDGMKKVYSLWIMPKAPKRKDGHMNVYETNERIICGTTVEEKEVYVSILKGKQELPKDEQQVYDLLYYTSQDRKEFPISDLNLFAKHKYNQYSHIVNNIVNYARNSLYELNLVDKAKEKQYVKSKNARGLKNMVLFLYGEAFITYLISLMFRRIVEIQFGMTFLNSWIIILLCLLPLIAVATYSWNLRAKIGDRIAVLTQNGADEKAKWKGLSNFMKDYSLLNEKEVLDLV